MDASNTGEARMSEVLSFPFSDFEKEKWIKLSFRFRSRIRSYYHRFRYGDSEATITDSDQSSILSIDDDEGSEIEFNTSEKSANCIRIW
jgi:hypothetical protein